MDSLKLLSPISRATKLARALAASCATLLLLASAGCIWFMLVFRGFVSSIRGPMEPLPAFLEPPIFAMIVAAPAFLALLGLGVLVASIRRAPPNNSFKPKPLRGSA